jgi:transcriptional regulator with XRE-family HTH domain
MHRTTLEAVDTKTEIRDFLTTRRARLSPEQSGIASYGSRRVAGLRREEVAVLAGLSVTYYTRMERGDLSGASESVLEALARALQLDEAERAHLFDLARSAQPTGAPPRRRKAKPRVRPAIQQLLDAMTGAAAVIGNDHLDVLGANALGRALFSEMVSGPGRPANFARFVFLEPAGRDFYTDRERAAADTVAILRSAAGRDPRNRELTDLIGQLATRSDDFRARWAEHNVRFHRTAVKQLHHPVVGDLELDYESLALSADTGLTISTYTAQPGSKSADALALLGSWTATTDPTATTVTPDRP